MEEQKGEDNPIDWFKKVYEACGLSFYVLHPLYEKSVGTRSAEYSKDTKEKNIFSI